MIVFAVLATVLALPFAGLNFFRLFENELVRQTERELISQSVVLAAIFSREVDGRLANGLKLGVEQPADARAPIGERYNPIAPQLDLSRCEIEEPRPLAEIPNEWAAQSWLEIGKSLALLTDETQKRTLAGFRLLDPKGRIITGRNDVGLSLAHVEEVAVALGGRYASALRKRVSDEPPPPVYSISRGTQVRVFVALPVILRNQVAGVVYASRTPSNIVKYLYGERHNVALAALAVITAALLVGFVFLRAVTRPIRELNSRAQAIGHGDRTAIRPLKHHGTSEIATLSQSFFSMAERLFTRSDFISNFAAHVSHELKSPLTSIQGAAELLRDSDSSMSASEREKFLNNIIGDTERLAALLERLRELAKADNPQTSGSSSLQSVLAETAHSFPELAVNMQSEQDHIIAISKENARIVFSHLFDNAERHRAQTIDIDVEGDNGSAALTISDNGEGISEQNRDKVFDTFFTTRRESGGTGMGLRIVQAMLTAHGGSIELLRATKGASFEVRIPLERT